MSYNHSVVIIAPNPQKLDGVAFCDVLGFAPGFAVALTDGSNTFSGLHAWGTTAFKALFSLSAAQIKTAAAAAGLPVKDWTLAKYNNFRSALIVSIDPVGGETGRAHFDLVLAAHGLTQVSGALLVP